MSHSRKSLTRKGSAIHNDVAVVFLGALASFAATSVHAQISNLSTVVTTNPVGAQPGSTQYPAASGTVPGYLNGYATTNPNSPNAGQTINPQTGVATGISYSYNTQNIGGTTYSVTPGVYSGTNGINLSEDNTTNISTSSRIYTSFTVPQGATITLNTITFYSYVTDTGGTLYNPGTTNPFSAAHIVIYNSDPNNFGVLGANGQNVNEQKSLVFGDDSFKTNSLTSAVFTGQYRIPTASATTDLTRPIYALTLSLSSTPLAAGTYFFAVSTNSTLNPGREFAIQADPTDASQYQPASTNGTNGIFFPSTSSGTGVTPNSYQTATVGTNTGGNPLFLAFPYLLNGLSSSSLPEPSAVALLCAGGGLIGGMALKRRRSCAVCR